MCNCVAFYAFCAFAKHLIWPLWGREPGSVALDSGRLATSQPFQLDHPIFLEIVRKSKKRAKIDESIAAIWAQKEGRPDWWRIGRGFPTIVRKSRTNRWELTAAFFLNSNLGYG